MTEVQVGEVLYCGILMYDSVNWIAYRADDPEKKLVIIREAEENV